MSLIKFLEDYGTFVLALVGALAWLPQVIQLIIRITSKPKLTIIIQNQSEIGYTTNGPIINLYIAISAENIGCLVNKIELDIQGPANSQHTFRWEWFEETFYEIGRADLGQSMPVSKNQTAIALKISKEGLVEKKMGFHEVTFKNLAASNFQLTTERHIHIEQGEQGVNTLKGTTEYNNYKNQFENSCFWTTGKYVGTVRVFAVNVSAAFEQKFTFILTAIDVRNLKGNIKTCIEVLERHYFPRPTKTVHTPAVVNDEPKHIDVQPVAQVQSEPESEMEIKWNWAQPRINC